MDFLQTVAGSRFVNTTIPCLVEELQNINKPKKYQYKTLPADEVATCLQVITNPDAYISADATSNATHNLLEEGYRWVRSDGHWAIFEKQQ